MGDDSCPYYSMRKPCVKINTFMKTFHQFIYESIEDQIRLTRDAVKRLRDEMSIRSKADPNFGFRPGDELKLDVSEFPVNVKAAPDLGSKNWDGNFLVHDTADGGRSITVRGMNLNDVLSDPDKMNALTHEFVHGLQHSQQMNDILTGKLPKKHLEWTQQTNNDEVLKILRKVASPSSVERTAQRMADQIPDPEMGRFPGMKERVPTIHKSLIRVGNDLIKNSAAVKRAKYLGTDIETGARGVTDSIAAQDRYRENLAKRLSALTSYGGLDALTPEDIQTARNDVRGQEMRLASTPENVEQAHVLGTINSQPSTVSFRKKFHSPSWLKYVSPKLHQKLDNYLQNPNNIISRNIPPERTIELPSSVRRESMANTMDAFDRSSRKHRAIVARGLQMVDPDLSSRAKVQEFIDAYSPKGPLERALGKAPSLVKGIGGAIDVLNPAEALATSAAGRIHPMAGGVAGLWGVADSIFAKEAQAQSAYDPNMEAMAKEGNVRRMQSFLGRGYNPEARTSRQRTQ